MIEVYEYHGDDGHEFLARFNDDGTVDGTSIFADRLRGWLQNDTSFDYVEENTAVDILLEYRYDNAAYQTYRE